MPLFNVVPARPIGQLNLGGRVPCSIFSRENASGLLVSTTAQIGANESTNYYDGGTARFRQRTHTNWGITDLQVLVSNYYVSNGDAVAPATSYFTTVSVEYPAGTFHVLTIGGSTNVQVAPGAYIITDPYTISIPANTYFWIRLWSNVQAPSQVSPGVPIGSYCGTDPFGVDSSVDGDNYPAHTGTTAANANASYQLTTSGTAWISGTNNFSFGPSAVFGTPTIAQPVSVACIGDSICAGVGDTSDAGGFLSRGLITKGLPFYKGGHNGEQSYVFYYPFQRAGRMLLASNASSVIYEYGTNDLAGTRSGASLSAYLGYLLPCLQALGAGGQTIWVTTLTPRTTSTDSWVTATNQTVITSNSAFTGATYNGVTYGSGYNGIRLAVNAYYRAAYNQGAGNSLAYDLAQLGIKFGGVIDVAQATETTSANTAPNADGQTLIASADRWYVNGGVAPTADGIHPSATVHTSVLAPLVAAKNFV